MNTGRLNKSRRERKEKPMWIRIRAAVYKKADLITLFSCVADDPLGSASCRTLPAHCWRKTSCCLLLCFLLPAAHSMLSSSEAMYSMGMPWDGCSSRNPHSFIGCTQAMFSKPLCKRRGWFSFILRTYFKALRRHFCHFRVWTEQCKEASVQTETTLISCWQWLK